MSASENDPGEDQVSNTTIIRELTRVQAAFQLRAIMAAMDLPTPFPNPETQHG